MPRITKLYETSRKGLAHNMGGFFGKPKKKEGEPEKPKPLKGKISDVGKEARSAIDRRKAALREAMKN